MVVPGSLCKRLLHELADRPGSGERPHVLEVSRRETLHLRELPAKIGREAVDDLGPPPLLLLPNEDDLPDVPVQEQHGYVRSHDHPQPFLVDAVFEGSEQLRVVVGDERVVWHRTVAGCYRATMPASIVDTHS